MTEENRLPEAIEAESAVVSESSDGAAAPDFGGEAAGGLARAGHEMASYVGRIAEVAKAENAVGPAHSVGGHTVVPLAAVSIQGGFGMGFGGGGGSVMRRNQGGGSGGGAGGGGRGSARVIAVADISEDGVVVKPVTDVTRLALAMMALLGLRMLRRGGGPRGAGRRLMSMLRRG